MVWRYREQAHSYNWIGVSQFGVGWLGGRYRWRASSHRDWGWAVGDGLVGGWLSRAGSLLQLDWVGSVWDWVAVGALSLAGQLPRGLGLGSGRWVGWSVAIASRLTPTIGLGWGSLGLVGCGGVIAGWPAPTGIGLGSGRWVGGWVGWLVGSYREQAHSYNWIGLGQFGIGWMCGRYRWRASSHRDWGVGGDG